MANCSPLRPLLVSQMLLERLLLKDQIANVDIGNLVVSKQVEDL